ncbi:MAG: L-threonylcarbamoyladenylate synthase [Candidatus Moranbacteria bacterium]|nr:L-threonylcarbamoyladenylate synthase [Candidatus Moranbacteria bacterium]
MQNVKKYVDILRGGGVGIVPTDTIYGIVGSALNARAVERIYSVRDRQRTNPMIVLVSSLEDLLLFDVDESLRRSLDEFWSVDSLRPTSVILPCIQERFSYLHRGSESIAFRLPLGECHAVFRDFLQKTGPLVAPSANVEGQPHAETISQARDYFGDKVDFYLMADKEPFCAEPSRIVRVSSSGVDVLRA